MFRRFHTIHERDRQINSQPLHNVIGCTYT